MRTRQIEVLHAILQAGSITGAARLLEVSQPTITSMLCSVEASTGLALFRREGNRLVATPEVKALAPALGEASASLEALRRMARNLRPDVARQPLRVCCAPSLAQTVLPVALASLRRQVPDLVVVLGSAQQTRSSASSMNARSTSGWGSSRCRMRRWTRPAWATFTWSRQACHRCWANMRAAPRSGWRRWPAWR